MLEIHITEINIREITRLVCKKPAYVMMNDKCVCNDFKDLKIQICFRQKGNTRYINRLKLEYINAFLGKTNIRNSKT